MIRLIDQPQHAECAQGINKLAEALAKVHGRIGEIEALMRTAAPVDSDSAHVTAALEFAQTGTVRAAGFDLASLSQEHVVLRTQREALEKAIRAQHEALHGVTQELSHGVCKEMEAKHRQLAKRYVAKLLELDAMHEEEMAFMREIEDAGYHASFLQYVRSPLLGMRRQMSESALWHRVRELQRYAAD